MPLKRSFKAKFQREYMFFGTRSPNLRSIFKAEVELVMFLFTCMPFEGLTSAHLYMSTRNGEFDFEVHFQTTSRSNGVSAHAHVTKSQKRRKCL